MADRVPYPDTGTRPGTPRWVKALGITALALVLLVVAVMLIGGGEHGPGRHEAMGDAGGETPVATASAALAARPMHRTRPESSRSPPSTR